MEYYDPLKRRLIYTGGRATPDYWDKHWNTWDVRGRILGSGKNSYVARITKKYLDSDDGPILEGGCGLGSKVESLRLNGYRCIGVDNAIKTVQALQTSLPELDIRLGDVRKLDFPDNYFAGYWSLGVIEPFRDGYDDIMNEMLRVIRPGGYLFLQFPYMSYYRRLKSKLGLYGKFEQDAPDFYQFALNAQDVIEDFEGIGFKLIRKKPKGVLGGLKDENPSLNSIIDSILRYRNTNISTKVSYFLLDHVLSMVFGYMFGHTILLLFEKAD